MRGSACLSVAPNRVRKRNNKRDSAHFLSPTINDGKNELFQMEQKYRPRLVWCLNTSVHAYWPHLLVPGSRCYRFSFTYCSFQPICCELSRFIPVVPDFFHRTRSDHISKYFGFGPPLSIWAAESFARARCF